MDDVVTASRKKMRQAAHSGSVPTAAKTPQDVYRHAGAHGLIYQSTGTPKADQRWPDFVAIEKPPPGQSQSLRSAFPKIEENVGHRDGTGRGLHWGLSRVDRTVRRC